MNKTFLIGKINLSFIGVLSVAMPFFSFNLLLEKLFRVTLIMSRFGWCKQYYIPIYGIYLCHVCFMTVFFFIVKVVNDLCVARSSDQSLIFPILSPAASFDAVCPLSWNRFFTGPPVHPWCLGFVVSLFTCLTSYTFPVFAVYIVFGSYWLNVWVGLFSVYLSLLVRWSHPVLWL